MKNMLSHRSAAIFACLLTTLLSCFDCTGSPGGSVPKAAAEGAKPVRGSKASSRATKEVAMHSNRVYSKPSDADLRARLSPLEYEVTQHEATEPAFQNRFWDNH